MTYVCDSERIDVLKSYSIMLMRILKEFSWLSDAYVLDFFVDNHWNKLPSLWQDTLDKMNLDELCAFLSPSPAIFKSVLPLSLQAFRRTTFALTWPREVVNQNHLTECLKKITRYSQEAQERLSDSAAQVQDWKTASEELSSAAGQHEHLDHIFRRHVKPKKQHEIFRCAEVVDRVCTACECCHVLDVGSGRGHLSRFLGFKYGLNVISVEGDGCHVSGAKKFDSQTLEDLQKQRKRIGREQELPLAPSRCALGNVWHPPKHMNFFISPTSDTRELLKMIFPDFQDECTNTNMPLLTLLGLHTCGNLASTMLRLYAETSEICALLSVGCCYMKLDSDGFPLSSINSKMVLSYEAKEVACHALEQYALRITEGMDSLKIHCFRATLEVLIQKHHPKLKHVGLRSIKHSTFLTFEEYAKKALSKKGINIPSEEYKSAHVQECLALWKRVVVFYSVRLMIAPLIESLILLDRMLYLFEKGYSSCLIPIFDCGISPRNHLLVSVKS